MKRILIVAALLLATVLLLAACGGAVQFKLNFIVDGEVYATIDTSGNEAIKLPENPTKEGEVFDGWYWDKDTWQKPFTANSLLDAPLSSDMNVYAKWESDKAAEPEEITTAAPPAEVAPAQFNLKFMVDGEVYGTVTTAGNAVVSLPQNPSKEGYDFDGWYWDKDTWQKPFTANSLLDAPLSSDMNVYAKWKTDQSLIGKQAEIVSAPLFAIDGQNLSLTLPNATESFSFIGQITVSEKATWQISTDIYGMNAIPTKTVPLNIEDNTFYLLVTSGDTNNINLYTVKIRRRPIDTVTFDSNGGSEVASQQVEEDSLATKPSDPERTGYTFAGWDYDFATPITEDTKITATWKPTVYKISYELNGGTNAATNPTTYTIESEAITFVEPTRTGYDFAGWDISEIPNGSYGNKTIAASWTPTVYTITYNLNGGTNSANNPKTYTIEDGTITFANPTRNGYDFAGWDISEIPSGSTGSKTITASWSEAIVYNISYELNGGENAAENPATYTIESNAITFAKPTKEGYTFTGWSISSIPHGSTGDKTITASWTPIVYNITYILNGGKNAAANPATYTIESDTITFANPTRNGYGFAGWDIPSIPSGSTGSKTITASWSEPIVYTITYELDGGTNAESNPATYTVESDTIVFAEPTRTGYVFARWSISSIPSGSYGNKTITAQWNAIFNISGNSITSLTATGGTLSQIEIPSKIDGVAITNIGEHAFYGYTGLTSITIPNSVTSIGSDAFYHCTGLTSITIGNSVTSIGSSAFSGCTGLTSVTIGNSVISIGNYAFRNCTRLTSVTIPNSVTSIGDCAFYECYNLTSITIPDSVTSVESSAFSDCSKLQYNIYDNAKYLGNESNRYVVLVNAKDTTITSCTISEQTKVIAGHAFSGRSGLTSITIPNSVTSIGEYAFFGCTGLTSVTVESGNTKYHSAGNCLIETASKTLILGCKNSVIPTDGSITSIGSDAFRGCTGLTSVTIGNGVTSIGARAFYECYNLTSVMIGNSVSSIGWNAFYGCKGLTSIAIPDSVTSIGDMAFYKCTGLTSIAIPDSVTSIGSYAFNGCTCLTSVTIGNSVSSIGCNAFYNCSNLTSVTFTNKIGWYITKTYNASSGTDWVPINPRSAANSLTSQNYAGYYWYRK